MSSSATSSSSGHGLSSKGEIVTIQCGAAANWIGTQYHLLQNSNCDVNSSFARHTHFRRSDVSSKSVAAGDRDSSVWNPRVVSLDASVGLDGIVATFAQQRDSGDHEELIHEYSEKAKNSRNEEAKSSGSSTSKATATSNWPKSWTDLAKNILPFHHKSLYSLPGLYEGTSDFHLHEQGKAMMERETIHEAVIDRVRWFLEECDQPDGLHLIVDGNTGWSGVGSTLLGLLRDEYERIPIFCISSLMPPAPTSALGESFASRTTLLQSVLNSSLLMQSASQLATAYLPLTTHYWPTNGFGHAAITRGELYESSTLMAWMMHLATADYRLQPRSLNMATSLSLLTQETHANIISAKLLTQQQLDVQDQTASSNFHPSDSASNTAILPIHTAPGAIPLSLIGHDHSFRSEVNQESLHDDAQCGVNRGLREQVHVFRNTENLSHHQLVKKMEQQPPAMLRRVFGTTHLNLPPSFPPSYYDFLNDGHVLTTYRCSSVGRELAHFGTWLRQMNRGAVTSSHYTPSSEDSQTVRLPALLSQMQTQRQRNVTEALDEDGERTRGSASEQLTMTQWTQDELDEFIECGTTMENLAELY